MKVWKRLSGALIALLALTMMMTGTALAAEPGGISVQLNGGPVAFTDAAPELSGGRTFVPLRAVMEAMNAQVDYDGDTGTVAITRGDVELSMVLGQNTVSVTEDGQSRTVEMDVTPYVKEGRTYVPVRFVAEAWGCGVGWDADTSTVIIVDVDTLLGDATFDLMDSFAAYCAKQEKNQNMAMTGTLALDAADKSGQYLPKPIRAKGSIDGITGGKGLQMNWRLELSGLDGLVSGGTESPMEQILLQQLLSALSALKGEVRMDLESGMLYQSVPAELTGGSGDTWYSVDLAAYQAQLLGALDMTQLTQLKEDATIREALTAVIQAMPLNDSEYSYAGVAEVTEIYVDMLSDQAFTQKGNTYVAQGAPDMPITITLAKQGDDIVSADITVDFDSSKFDASLQPTEKISMKLTEHAAPDKVTVDMDMAMEDSDASMKLTLDLSCVPTTKSPVTTLPAGVQAVPMN